MIIIEPMLTTAGKGLFTRAVGGETITFTRFKGGSGQINRLEDAESLTDLVHPEIAFSITDIDKDQAGYVRLTGNFDSTIVHSDFVWREIGLYCKGEDDTETLYAYMNDGNNSSLLKASTGSVQSEQSISFVIAIGDAENVEAILAESQIYALKSDLDAHTENVNNPHSVTKAQVGLGNVPNRSTNDQTPTYTINSTDDELTSGEKLSVAFGKIARAIRTLISHITNRNNPHGVTVSQIGAAPESHTHSITQITSGTLSVARGGTGVTSLTSLRNQLGFGGTVEEPLPATSGGTGETSLNGLRAAMGLGDDTTEPLDVSHGGTGVTTLGEVRAELGLGDDVSAPLDVEHGGTGLNTQAAFEARVAYPVLTGSYIGDGVKERVISLGFTPRLLIIYGAMGSIGSNSTGIYHGLFILYPGTRALNYDCTHLGHLTDEEHTHTAAEIIDGGFKMWATNNYSANYNGTAYHYVAFR